MPSSLRPAAISRRDAAPAAMISAMAGATSAARSLARFWTAARALVRVLADGFTPRSPPSFCPRRFAAARAALVRALISPASSSATAAICCSIKRPVAPSIWGRSAKRTSTPASSKRDRKARERVNRSTLLTTSAHLWRRAYASALWRPEPTRLALITSRSGSAAPQAFAHRPRPPTSMSRAPNATLASDPRTLETIHRLPGRRCIRPQFLRYSSPG